jgi:hypothetical protein
MRRGWEVLLELKGTSERWEELQEHRGTGGGGEGYLNTDRTGGEEKCY